MKYLRKVYEYSILYFVVYFGEEDNLSESIPL